MRSFFNIFFFLFFALICPKPLLSSEYTWIAQGSNCDLNTATNWSPNAVPGIGDIAIFNSNSPSVCLSPTSVSDFTVGQLHFTDQASVFSFTFTNCELIFEGTTVGITGVNTNPIINMSSASGVSVALYLQGSVSNNLGSAKITSVNTSSGVFYQSWCTVSPVLMGDSGSLIMKNSETGSVTGSQINFPSFTCSDHMILELENNGGSVGAGFSQFQTTSFSCGDFLTFTVSNYGDLTASSSVGSSAGFVQIDTLQVGNNATFTLSNVGIQQSSSSNLTAGYSYDPALNVGTFTAGNNLALTVKNSGTVSSSSVGGSGNYIGYVNNSLVGFSTFHGGDSVSITASNEGINSGVCSGDNIGVLNENLLGFTDFIAGDDLNISITNSGSSSGNCSIITNIGNAIDLFVGLNTFSSKDRSTISISNFGSLTFNSSDVGNCAIGQIQDEFLVNGDFTTGDDFHLTVSNTGINENLHFLTVAYIASASNQASFGSNVVLGKSANIEITNSASYLGNDSDVFMCSPSSQFRVGGSFQAGDNLSVSVTNSSTNPNSIATVGSVTDQIYFVGNCILNEGSSLIATNSQNGIVTNQMLFSGGLTIHGKASLEANNLGVLNGHGIYVQNSLGGDLSIILKNSSLRVDNSSLLQPFTIGSLVAETTSSVFANQGLIIDTDSGVNATFNGTVSSTPFLIKNGPGTQTLVGTVDPVDMSYVNAGTLNVRGVFDGDITINSGGNFSGNATVNGTVINYGQISPNQLLTVTEFTNESSGVYYSSLGKNQNSYNVHATGNVSLLGGVVQTAAIDEYTFHKSYVILSSDSAISGTFAGLAPSELFSGYLSYDTNHVYLTIAQNLSAAAKTHNEKMVANQIDSLSDPNPVQSHLINELTALSLSQATNALASLSGKQYANEAYFTEEVSRQFIRRLYDPLRSIVTCNSCVKDCCNDFTTWTEAGGDFSFIDGDSLYGYQVTAGVQKRFCIDLTVGVAVSYEGDFISYQKQGGFEYQNHSLMGLYALYRPERFYVLGDIAYDYNINSMDRTIKIGSSKYKARSSPHNSELSIYGEIGGDFNFSKVLVQPFFGLEMDTSWRSHIHEKSSSGWQLNLYKKNHTDVFTRTGIHLSACKIPHNFWMSLDLAWDCRLTNQKITTNDRFALLGDSFSIWGTKLNRNSFDYTLTIANTISKQWNVYLQTSGQIYNHATTFGLLAGFGFSW